MKLHDALTRLSLYVDSLRSTKANEFRKYTKEMFDEIKKEFENVNYNTLDGLTKSDLNKLIVKIRRSMSKVYNKYAVALLEWLKRFMFATRKLVMQIMFYDRVKRISEDDEELDESLANAFDRDAGEPTEDEETTLFPLLMWAAVQKQKAPVNNMTIGGMITAFTAASTYAIVKVTKDAWANGDTVADTLDKYAAAFDKARGQEAAVTATATQQVYLKVKAAVMSAYYKSYIWVSILDSKTSDICLRLNGKVYRFGSGKLPPAHYRCRSHIEPYTGTQPPDESFDEWFSKQPKDVRNSANEALTLDKYAKRIDLILQ
ncbi:head morphogenesis [Acinetobacter phage Loki]|uniref:Putative head morphogenesis protein, SPP1 gp7 family n=1 Tax=Acinetobacter phage Loki TaxID=1970374 RepID=A0A0P1KLC6_9CAUD|nr:head morphogenesis [Acinetobacter phage Loki]CUS06465.1 putative head morphogenesis protein, SPP1 gp7 family [Acinetobacter phage Loki]